MQRRRAAPGSLVSIAPGGVCSQQNQPSHRVLGRDGRNPHEGLAVPAPGRDSAHTTSLNKDGVCK